MKKPASKSRSPSHKRPPGRPKNPPEIRRVLFEGAPELPAKRKAGRPTKPKPVLFEGAPEPTQLPKRKPGRPPKPKPVISATDAQDGITVPSPKRKPGRKPGVKYKTSRRKYDPNEEYERLLRMGALPPEPEEPPKKKPRRPSVISTVIDVAKPGWIGKKGVPRHKAPGWKPNPIDVWVGHRVRARRVSMGITLEKLAEVALVFRPHMTQYERGIRPVTMSVLVDFARILLVPISYFFDHMPEDVSQQSPRMLATGLTLQEPDIPEPDIAEEREVFRLIAVFNRVHDKHMRAQVIDLAQTFARLVEKAEGITTAQDAPQEDQESVPPEKACVKV